MPALPQRSYREREKEERERERGERENLSNSALDAIYFRQLLATLLSSV